LDEKANDFEQCLKRGTQGNLRTVRHREGREETKEIEERAADKKKFKEKSRISEFTGEGA